jgi:hypothetical protein
LGNLTRVRDQRHGTDDGRTTVDIPEIESSRHTLLALFVALERSIANPLTQFGDYLWDFAHRQSSAYGYPFTVSHSVEDLIPCIEDEAAVVFKVVVHPYAEIDVHPFEIDFVLGVFNRVIPNGNALLIIGHVLYALGECVLDYLAKAVLGQLVATASG